MNKLVAVIVASAFAFSSAAGFAADTAKKKEELTKEDRVEMRNRAERLKADRMAQGPTQEKSVVEKTHKAKAHHTPKTKNKPEVKKAEPKA